MARHHWHNALALWSLVENSLLELFITGLTQNEFGEPIDQLTSEGPTSCHGLGLKQQVRSSLDATHGVVLDVRSSSCHLAPPSVQKFSFNSTCVHALLNGTAGIHGTTFQHISTGYHVTGHCCASLLWALPVSTNEPNEPRTLGDGQKAHLHAHLTLRQS